MPLVPATAGVSVVRARLATRGPVAECAGRFRVGSTTCCRDALDNNNMTSPICRAARCRLACSRSRAAPERLEWAGMDRKDNHTIGLPPKRRAVHASAASVDACEQLVLPRARLSGNRRETCTQCTATSPDMAERRSPRRRASSRTRAARVAWRCAPWAAAATPTSDDVQAKMRGRSVASGRDAARRGAALFLHVGEENPTFYSR